MDEHIVHCTLSYNTNVETDRDMNPQLSEPQPLKTEMYSQLALVKDHPDRGQGPEDEAANGEDGSLTHLLQEKINAVYGKLSALFEVPVSFYSIKWRMFIIKDAQVM